MEGGGKREGGREGGRDSDGGGGRRRVGEGKRVSVGVRDGETERDGEREPGPRSDCVIVYTGLPEQICQDDHLLGRPNVCGNGPRAF